jgi:hypothetical protein
MHPNHDGSPRESSPQIEFSPNPMSLAAICVLLSEPRLSHSLEQLPVADEEQGNRSTGFDEPKRCILLIVRCVSYKLKFQNYIKLYNTVYNTTLYFVRSTSIILRVQHKYTVPSSLVAVQKRNRTPSVVHTTSLEKKRSTGMRNTVVLHCPSYSEYLYHGSY